MLPGDPLMQRPREGGGWSGLAAACIAPGTVGHWATLDGQGYYDHLGAGQVDQVVAAHHADKDQALAVSCQ